MAATTAQAMGSLPSGLEICTTAPDIFYLPELVFGGLVWILVASTHVTPPNPLGWVMFVSIFCFVMTFLWMILFLTGCHKSSSGWAAAVSQSKMVEKCWTAAAFAEVFLWFVQDFIYHGLAVLFYLSAGVDLAFITMLMKAGDFKMYQIDISAVVFAFATTLLYFIHAILSAIRWKHF
uniref:Mal, T cell differentiation protein b n=1 Tax=Oryzias melastigma TaxID=30732 RepID=A0A3B3DJQ6_ORYME